jgi:hypothetical protein
MSNIGNGGLPGGGSLSNNFMPPRCEKHDRQLVFYIYDRPGSLPGNGWSCPECTKESVRWQKIEQLLNELMLAVKEAKQL